MEVSGANPFLMMGEEHTSPPSNLNPFLMDDNAFDNAAVTTDNPFFSSAEPIENIPVTANNPFAFDSMDYAPVTTSVASTNIFGNVIDEPVFSSSEISKPIEQMDFMSGNDTLDVSLNSMVPTSVAIPTSIPTSVPPQVSVPSSMTPPTKPTDLNIQNETSISDDERKLMPMRPPPPRPPMAKETQDLIMSVTGAMDATSSHLLDRIPPTRTPSPVSMRDLHSPSPTPDLFATDLVDVSSGQTEPKKEVNLFDLDDDILPTSTAQPTMQPTIQPTIQQTKTSPITNNTDLFGSAINSEPTLIPTTVNESFSSLVTNDIKNDICDINQNQPAAPVKQPSRPPPPQKPPPPKVPPPVAARPNIPSTTTSPSVTQAPPKPAPPKPAPPKPTPPKPPLPSQLAQSIPQSAPSPITTAPTSLAPSKETSPEAIQPVNATQPIFNETLNEATILESEPLKQALAASPLQEQILQNPFSFQEDTKVIESVTNTQALFDDFSIITSSASSTAPTNNNTIFEVNNAFKPTETKEITSTGGNFSDIFGSVEPTPLISDQSEVEIPKKAILEKFQRQSEEFDAFAAKFESAKDNSNNAFDPFGGSAIGGNSGGDAWGSTGAFGDDKGDSTSGFGAEEPFDSFLSLSEPPPPPQTTPARLNKADSDSDEEKDFAVFIKPKNLDLQSTNQTSNSGFVPTLAPPPKSPIQSSLSDTSPRFNPFDQQQEPFAAPNIPEPGTLPQESAHMERTDSQETPPTPLFDEDTSQPLEDFPRAYYKGDGWEMQLRQPNKKKITGQRFWKKIFLKLVYQGDNPVLQLYNAQTDKDPFQELPLQACYSVSEIGAQQYDQFGKIFTIKLQYVFYKERPGVRPGQVTKAERITNKLSQFAAYAIQGDYQGVKEFGSDLKKLGLPVEHAPQISQLFKIGTHNYEHMKEFSMTVEEALFRLTVHRDRALHYKMEEVQITAVDELYVEQNAEGGVDKQIARVRLFFLGFLSGMPDIELGVNDMRRQGKEVVGRHDIIPVVTEEWIRLENIEFHACVQQEEYHKTHIIRFKPPDACYIELMRFRVRPPKNRELPLQLKAVMCVTGNRVELRADVLVPGFASRKLGQVPCEDVMIRFPIPECWIYLFRVEKHFRYGSVKSAHRRSGKIKGIERFLGTVETLQESLIEVTSGQAKYEHQHRSIVWRCPRLPKEGQGAYTTHNLVCRMALTSYDQIPDQLAEYAYVEFTMPATQVSHTTVRSVSVQGSDSDEPPEKYVRYLARHEYRVGIEHTQGENPNAYAAATQISRPAAEPQPAVPATVPESSESDSD